MSRDPKTIAVTVLSVLLGVGFIFMFGGSKLIPGSNAGTIENFANWGYPAWFVYVTGIIEVIPIRQLVRQLLRILPQAGRGVFIRPERFSAAKNFQRFQQVDDLVGHYGVSDTFHGNLVFRLAGNLVLDQ